MSNVVLSSWDKWLTRVDPVVKLIFYLSRFPLDYLAFKPIVPYQIFK